MSLTKADVLPEAPQSADDYCRRGWANYILGEHENAENDYRSAIEIDSQHVEAAYGLALVSKTRGREAEWRPLFERVIQLLKAGHMDDNRGRAAVLGRLSEIQLNYLPEKDWKPVEE